MALIYVYKGVGNECDTYTKNGKIKDFIKDVDFSKTLIIKNGEKLSPDYEVKDDDVIFIRQTPAAASTVAIVVAAVSIVAAGVGIGIGVKSYLEQQEMQEQMDKDAAAAKAANETRAKLPFVKGSKNQIATGNTLPYIIGKTLFTPYLLSSPFYTFAGNNGSKSYYNAVLEIGYAKNIINKISLGTTDLLSFENGMESGVKSITEGTYGDSENRVEIVQSGDFTLDKRFNEKWISENLTTEIPHRYFNGEDADEGKEIQEEWEAGIVQELSAHAMAVEVVVLLDGCRKYDDGWKNQKITLTVEYCTDRSNPVWIPFEKGFNQNGSYSNTFDYKTKEQMRFVASQTFTAEEAFGSSMAIRVKRTTPKAESNANDTIYLLAVQTKCYDVKKSSKSSLVVAKPLEDSLNGKCTRIALRMISNENTKDNLDAFNVTCTGCARVWNGSSWSTTKSPTRNLASWVLEILTSSTHRPSKYEDDELDLNSFGSFYEYCENEKFYADGAIINSQTKKSTIETLLQNANATLVYQPSTGKMEIAIDNERNYSVALLNSDNIISMQMTKEYKRLTDGRRCTYLNSEEDFVSDTETFMRDDGTYDSETDTLTKLSRDFITTHDHIYKYAWREMAVESAQPRVITVKVGPCGAYYPIYDCIDLQHNALCVGLGNTTIKNAEYKGGLLKKLYLDGYVDFPSDSACAVIVNACAGSRHGVLALKVSNAENSSRTHTLNVTTVISISDDVLPGHADTLSFGTLDTNGEFTKIKSKMKIVDAEPDGLNWTLTLRDYVPEMYAYGDIPEYTSNVTHRPNKTNSSTQNRDSLDDAINAAKIVADTTSDSASANAVAELVTNGVTFRSVHKINKANVDNLTNGINLENLQQKLDEIRKECSDGISISEDKITIGVSDKEKNIFSMIELTKESILQVVSDGDSKLSSSITQTAKDIRSEVSDIKDGLESTIEQSATEIIAQVDDMKNELTGLIDIQAGAVQALVEGGGATGRMALSLELPILIDSTTRGKFVAASSEAKVNAVYAKLESDNTKYAIKANATDDQVKALWDDAVIAGLLASRIKLTADQIRVATSELAINASQIQINSSNIFVNGELQADYIDVDTLAAEIMEVSTLTVKSTLTLGDGTTNGVIQSHNYAAGSAGFKIDGNTGAAEFRELTDTIFKNITIGSGDVLIRAERYKIDAGDFGSNYLYLLPNVKQGSLKILIKVGVIISGSTTVKNTIYGSTGTILAEQSESGNPWTVNVLTATENLTVTTPRQRFKFKININTQAQSIYSGYIEVRLFADSNYYAIGQTSILTLQGAGLSDLFA